MLLEMEAWLKQPSVLVASVLRFRTKVRELMETFKRVVDRQVGMGMKVVKFHATKHVPDDIPPLRWSFLVRGLVTRVRRLFIFFHGTWSLR